MRFASLPEWLSWQESLHSSSIDMGLERVQQVAARLFTREDFCNIISVAGTNGKGSVCATLSAIYHGAGYRCGWYSSPHLLRYNERVRINDEEIDDQRLCEAFEKVDQAREDISLTYFEFGTLAALEIFRQADLDILILEVGLGGRLDAVNILDPDVAVITSIDLDHQDWLGNDRESIAKEKLGIIRPDKPLVCGEIDPPDAINARCEERQVPLFQIGQDFTFVQQGSQWQWQYGDEKINALPRLVLNGRHQYINAAVALMASRLLKQRLPLSAADIKTGLLSTRLAGRIQRVQFGSTHFILDVAHNPQATSVLAQTLRDDESMYHHQAVLAMLQDKDIASTLGPMLAIVEQWHIANLSTPRGADTQQIRETLLSLGVKDESIHCYDNVEGAINSVIAHAAPEQRNLVFGSFFTVSAAMEILAE